MSDHGAGRRRWENLYPPCPEQAEGHQWEQIETRMVDIEGDGEQNEWGIFRCSQCALTTDWEPA